MMKHNIEEEIPHLRAFARSLARDPHRADDLVQEALTKALSNADKFKVGTNFRAWLFTILRNTFISERRKAKREAPMPEDADDLLQGAPGNQEQSVRFDEVVRALHALPWQFREALILVGAAGFKIDEASQILDIPEGTVKSRVSRARCRLASALEDGEVLPSLAEAQPTFDRLDAVLTAGALH